MTDQKSQKQQNMLYYQVYEPYVIYYSDSEYFVLNRNYRYLGDSSDKYVSYPDMCNYIGQIVLYKYDTEPWQSEKNREQYEAKKAGAMLLMKGKKECTDLKPL